LTLDRRSQKSSTHQPTDKSVTNKILEKLERGNHKKIYHRQPGPTSQGRGQEKITLYRRYRYGDYPDLLINDLALLMPLQGLVKRDNKLARMVFVELFKSIVTELDATTLSSVLHELNTCIQRIITQTVNCDYTLYATIMELSIMHAQQIDLQPDVVAITANVSNMMIMGVLYLEKRLSLDVMDTESSSSKKTTSTVTIEDFCWYKLSELYSNLSEADMSSGILTDKLNFSSSIRKAAPLEADGDFLAAYREYRKIVQSEKFSTTIEQNFCYQSYYDSLVQMGMWAELFETVQKGVDSYNDFWTDDFNQEHLLPHLIRSELRLILYGQGGTNVEFLKVLDSWLRDPEKSEFIKMNYGEELTMLYIAHGDFKTARVYSENMLRFFFTEWEKLNVLSDKVRADKLLTVRKVAEIHNCSRYLLNEPNANLEADLTALCNSWSKSALDNSDSVTLWDSIVVSRHYIALTLANRLSSSHAAANLYQSVIDTSFKLLEVAIAQKNVMFSEKLISRVAVMCDRPCGAESHLLKLRLEMLMSKLQIVKAGRESAIRSQNLLVDAWTKLQSIVDSGESPVVVGLKVMCYEELSTIGKKLFISGQKFGIDKDVEARIFSLATSISTGNLKKKNIFCKFFLC
jgi:DNA-dependent protein kinase catalytic subunit